MSLYKKTLKALYWIGYGVVLHDAAHQVWELKGTALSWEGIYVGLFFLGVTGFMLLHPKKAIEIGRSIRDYFFAEEEE